MDNSELTDPSPSYKSILRGYWTSYFGWFEGWLLGLSLALVAMLYAVYVSQSPQHLLLIEQRTAAILSVLLAVVLSGVSFYRKFA